MHSANLPLCVPYLPLQGKPALLSSTNVIEDAVILIDAAGTILMTSQVCSRPDGMGQGSGQPGRETCLACSYTYPARQFAKLPCFCAACPCTQIVTELFGYNRNELEGANVSMLMPQPYAQRHTSYLQAGCWLDARLMLRGTFGLLLCVSAFSYVGAHLFTPIAPFFILPAALHRQRGAPHP